MGAHIEGDGTDTLVVQGVSALHGATYRVMPDRIEVGTYLVAAAATRGHITIDGVNPDLLGIVLDKLRQTGADLSCASDSVALDMRGRRPLAVDIETQPSRLSDRYAGPVHSFECDCRWAFLRHRDDIRESTHAGS